MECLLDVDSATIGTDLPLEKGMSLDRPMLECSIHQNKANTQKDQGETSPNYLQSLISQEDSQVQLINHAEILRKAIPKKMIKKTRQKKKNVQAVLKILPTLFLTKRVRNL